MKVIEVINYISFILILNTNNDFEEGVFFSKKVTSVYLISDAALMFYIRP